MTENEVFRKIKEISTRKVHPRPVVNIFDLASELGTKRDHIMSSLNELKDLRLIKFNETNVVSVKLTLLGSVVKREK